MYCIQSVEAENEEALHMVEGEKVYVIGKHRVRLDVGHSYLSCLFINRSYQLRVVVREAILERGTRIRPS